MNTEDTTMIEQIRERLGKARRYWVGDEGKFRNPLNNDIQTLLAIIDRQQRRIDELEGKPVETVEYSCHIWGKETCRDHVCARCKYEALKIVEMPCLKCIKGHGRTDCYFTPIKSEESK
jgi:hypothetical protein